MAALATRAEIAAHHDFYLVPLPLTGETATQVEQWITAIVAGAQEAALLWDGKRWLGAGYEFERPLHAMVDGESVCWTERVQVVRSPTLAQRQQATLEKRLAAAEAELEALTPAPGADQPAPGCRNLHVTIFQHGGCRQLLARRVERHSGRDPLWAGDGVARIVPPARSLGSLCSHRRAAERGRHCRPAGIDLRWRVQVTNAPMDRLPLPQAVRHYRGGWSLERFSSPQRPPPRPEPVVCLEGEANHRADATLTLALRLLTLLETQVRRGLAQTQEPVAGLYEGSPTRTTERPTGTRILQAFARAQITLTHVRMGGTSWYLTPLSPLHVQLLRHLHLPPSLYTALADNSS